jgi:hypothetical protein
MPSLDLVVDTTIDAPDLAPGDGVCDDGTGACPLRAAIQETNTWPTPDTITIAAGIDPVLTRAETDTVEVNVDGDLDIAGHLTVDGGGATVDASGLDRVFHVHSHDVVLSNLVITGGSTPVPGNGGGVFMDGAASGGHLTIADSTVTGNRAGFGGGVAMSMSISGVVTEEQLTITGTTISGNAAVGTGLTGFGGALSVWGGDTTVVNSTLSGNTAISGGAVHTGWPLSADIDGPLTLIGTTVAGNSGTNALLRHLDPLGSGNLGGEIHLHGSIVQHAGNDCARAVTSLGRNLASDASCGLSGPGDGQNVDAQLGPLSANGGPTLTHLPGVLSPARGAIPVGSPGLCDGTLPTDQRGVARPQGAGCDVGAVEQ